METEPESKGAAATPSRAWSFVPPLYFMEGLPYVIVNTFSVLMFNKLGVPNSDIGLWTSLIALPWTLKMFWGPLVDANWTKRGWVLATQAVLALGLAVSAFTITLPAFLPATLLVFAFMALVSATHDIAADGFYLLALDRKAQAFFVGVRSTFYRLAMIFGSGVLVWFAGRILLVQNRESSEITGLERIFHLLDLAAAAAIRTPAPRAWSLALLAAAAVFAIGLLVNSLALPRPPEDRPQRGTQEHTAWGAAFLSFFGQNRIAWVLAFILFYRLGESMIGKMSGPFLQDPVAKGGLGIPTDEIGVISGTIGVLALTIGGILGGVVISRWGIKRCLWPMVLCLNVPNLFYVWAAFTRPGKELVAALIAVDQFGYGFGFTAYMVYLMYVSQGNRFETASYAIATGLMALGALGAGIASGYLQTALGYAWFFVAVCFLTIPGMITLFFIPLDRRDIYEARVEV